jgi:acetoin utilization protein AcuB
MSKPIPPVRKYMTTTPHTVRPDMTLAEVHKIMRQHNIRHLPVLEGGALIGLVSERDLRLVEAFKDVDPEKVPVSDAMSTEVYTISPDSALDGVARTMAAKKYGSAVVMDNGKVVGVFTAVDGLEALAELLHTRLAG